MNIVTKDELKYIEELRNNFIDNYIDFVNDISKQNEDVKEYLDNHEGKKFEVERTSYSFDKKVAKGKIKDPNKSYRPSEIIKKRNKVLNDRRLESQGEYLSDDLNYWLAAKYSEIRVNETRVNEMDPKDNTLTNEDYIQNHGSMLKKVALFSAARELNRKRSIFSRIFNWKRNIQNWYNARKIRKSIEQDNGLTKKEFKKLYKFIKDKDQNKYKNLVALSNDGTKLYNDGLVEEKKNIEIDSKVFEVKMDKESEKDRFIKASRKEIDMNIEISEPSEEKDEPYIY